MNDADLTQCTHQQRGERDSKERSGGGQRAILSEHLPEQVAGSGSEGGAQCELGAAPGIACEQQVNQVGAGDEEQHAAGSQGSEQGRTGRRAGHEVGERNEHRSERGRVLVGVVAQQSLLRGLKLGGGLIDRDIGSQTADGVEGRGASILRRLGGIAADGGEDGRLVQRVLAFERDIRGEHADDGVGLVIEPEGAVGEHVAPAHAAPVSIAHDGLAEAVAFAPGVRKVVAESDWGAQRGEEILRDEDGVGAADAGGGLDARRPAAIGRDGLKGGTAVLPVLDRGQGEPLQRPGRYGDQAVGLRKWEGLKNNRIQDAVHGGSDADADGENEDRGKSETWGATQLGCGPEHANLLQRPGESEYGNVWSRALEKRSWTQAKREDECTSELG